MAMSMKKRGPLYKFGVRVPRNVNEALILDKENGNTLWKDAIKKEMTKIIEFQVFKTPAAGKPPIGYKKIPCHMIFDVKHDGRFVAGGHLTLDPGEDSYSGAIAPDAVRLGMFAAAHNGLQVVAADIGNAYLHAKTKEKVYTILGEEYESLGGKTLIFDKGLYGLKTSGARFHEHLSDILRKMGFNPSKTNSDLWMKDCKTHYEYIAHYVDDILVFSMNPYNILECLKETYPLQSVGIPEYYIGGDFKIHKKDNGENTMTFCAKTYLTNVCERIEKLMNEKLKSYDTPMATNDHPEMDDSGLLNADEHLRFHMLIGCGQWAIILGQFDVLFAVQTMASFSHAPKQEHLQRMMRLFAWLFEKLSTVRDHY